VTNTKIASRLCGKNSHNSKRERDAVLRQRIQSLFSIIIVNRTTVSNEILRPKKEPAKVDFMEVDLLVDTLNDLFIEKVILSIDETRTPDPDLVLCSTFKKPPPLPQETKM